MNLHIIWTLVAIFIVAAVCGLLALLIWWLWRKITLPAGAPPPDWADLKKAAQKGGRGPVVVRIAAAGLLAALMSAPVGLIQDLIRERAANYQAVVSELSYSWGGQQLLIGPILSVPYTIRYTVTEDVPLSEEERRELARAGIARTKKTVAKEVTAQKTAIILPEELTVNGSLTPEARRRGIYSVPVYTADLNLGGLFKRPDFRAIDSRADEVHWNRASILVNLSDTKAFRGISPLSLAGRDYKFVPGTQNSPIAPTGFSAQVDLSAGGDIAFSFQMSIGGSQGFYVSPIAVTSLINLNSPWPHPRFGGTGLPTRHETTSGGFKAQWEVPNLVRNYPQAGDESVFDRPPAEAGPGYGYNPLGSSLMLAEYVVGLDFFEPVFHYSVLTRAVKYALMFISLTFLSVLVFEMCSGRAGARLHLVQYGVMGLGLCLFYLILLAASEHMSFPKAYVLATVVNILMIGGYVRAALGRRAEALTVSAILTALYSALFFILKMEDYSLASGTALMVLAMGALMYATRNLGRGQAD